MVPFKALFSLQHQQPNPEYVLRPLEKHSNNNQLLRHRSRRPKFSILFPDENRLSGLSTP